MTVGTRSGGGALTKQECRVPLLQALDEKSSKLEDFWNAKTEVVRHKVDRHGAADTSWIENIAECPVYYPSREDFMQDPLHYIQKIAPEASKFGMCKIVSPVVASVPAGVVLSKEQCGFKFTTRIQPVRLSNWDKDDKITFPMSGRTYTVTEYEKMANRVFARKFSTAGNLPPRFIESEFWKELAVGKTRTVEYATDVEGSAFSTSSTDPLGRSKWNLKRISGLPSSTLRLLEDPIPGVTDPMLYIGMLFSMFSWHIEDHYLYSINYQHCGAPKTWYGVPGDAAPCFEKVVREHVYNTELLRDTGKCAELDILLEKTTMFTPKLLSEQGVPVFKAIQYPGEFIVTFPRAYHAGFSHGFNCGEAVNFAMADWFSLGAEACSRYEFLNRCPLLPHEMLLCKEAAIISRIKGTRHDDHSCNLESHIKVAFVAWMRTFLQSMSSLKQQGAKMTTSNETRVFCGLCKHICYAAYTSCKCFPEPTCFNHGDFFSSCTCKGERIIVLKDDFAKLESIAQKFENEVEIRGRVQDLLSQNDSVKMENVSRVAEDTQFEMSLFFDVKDAVECCKTEGEKEKADNGGTIAQAESFNGATSSDFRQGQEEELSDTEVVQFKRRKVSLSQSKRFQVDEQEIAPEKFMVLTPKKNNHLKVESSCSRARYHFHSLKPCDGQAMVGVAGMNKATVNTAHEPFDTSSDSEVLRKRKKLKGVLVKVKRKRSSATLTGSGLAAEFGVDSAAKLSEKIKHEDSRNLTSSLDDGVSIGKEEQDQQVDGLSASDDILEGKDMELTLCEVIGNADDVLQERIDAEPRKADVGVSASMNDDCLENLSGEAVRFETDSPLKITGSSTDESNLTGDLTIPKSRNVELEMDTGESVNGRKVHDANDKDDKCVTTIKPAPADEEKYAHTEGICSSFEFRECETELENESFLLIPPAEAQPLVDLVEVQEARSNLCVTSLNSNIAAEGKHFDTEKICPSCEFMESETDLKNESFLQSSPAEAQPLVGLVEGEEARNIMCVRSPSPAIAEEGKHCNAEENCPSCEFRECETDSKSENIVLSPSTEAQPSVCLVEIQEARNNLPSSGAYIMPLNDCDKADAVPTLSLEPKKGLVIHLNRRVEQTHKKKVAEVIIDEDKSSICENLMEHVDILEGQSGGSAWCLDQEVLSSNSNQNDCECYSPSGPSALVCGSDLMVDHFKHGKAEDLSKEECDSKPEGLLEMGQLIAGQREAGNVIGLQGDFGCEFGEPTAYCESNDYMKGGQMHEGESSSTQQSYGVLENIDALSCRKNAIPPTDCGGWQKPEISCQVMSQLSRGPSSTGVCVPRDNFRREFPLSDTRLDAHSARLDSSNLHRSERHTRNFVDKPTYRGKKFGALDFELPWGVDVDLSQTRLQGRTGFSSCRSTGHPGSMNNSSQRAAPSYNHRPGLHQNHHPFQTDNKRGIKYPRASQRRPFSRWERRPRRHYSRGWRDGSLQNRSAFRADNPRVKGVSDAGFSAASSSAGSIHVEGYDPMKWEIYPAANSWQFSSSPQYVPPGWAERRP